VLKTSICKKCDLSCVIYMIFDFCDSICAIHEQFFFSILYCFVTKLLAFKLKEYSVSKPRMKLFGDRSKWCAPLFIFTFVSILCYFSE